MIDLDGLVFGYYDFVIGAPQAGTAADLLLSAGISARISADGRLRLKRRRAKAALKLFEGKVQYKLCRNGGIYGFLYLRRRRVGALLALFFTVLLYLYSLRFVWDVRIEGLDEAAVSTLEEELAANGLKPGVLWQSIDKSLVETNTLKISDAVSWLNINRRGCVAYISAIPKEVYEVEEKEGYANIVAAYDGVIEEIRTKSGYASVSVGDTVRAGQLLISGVIPAELGGGLVYAEGIVIARRSCDVEVFVPSTAEVNREEQGELCLCRLNFFNFSLNIFKRYGNSSGSCDIIEKNEEFFLPGGKKIPISLHFEYERRVQTDLVSYQSDELCRMASELLRQKIAKTVGDGQLLRAVTDGGFSDGGYTMRAELVIASDIGEIRKFKFDAE